MLERYTGCKGDAIHLIPNDLASLYIALGRYTQNIEGLRIIIKDPTYENQEYAERWHKITFTLARAMFFMFRILSFGMFKKKFSDFGNAMGNTIYMPAHIIQPHMPNYYAMLRHELQHCLDMKRYGLWFHFSYLLIGRMRAKWELRAYTQSMIAYYTTGGEVEQFRMDFYAKQFWSASYVFMWPFPRHIKRVLERIKAKVVSSEISAYDIGDFDVWKGE